MKASELAQVIAWVVLIGCFVLFGLSSNATLFLFLAAMVILAPLLWYLSLMKIDINDPVVGKQFFIWDIIVIIFLFAIAFCVWYFLKPHTLPDIEGNIYANNAIRSQFARTYRPYFLVFPLISYLLAIPLTKKSIIIAFCFCLLGALMMGGAALIGMPSNIG